MSANPDVEKLGRSLAGYKANLTRHLNIADGILKAANTTTKPSRVAGQLVELKDDIRQAYNKMLDAAVLYTTELSDDTARKNADLSVDQKMENATNKIVEINEALAKLPDPAPTLASAPVTSTVAVNERVKPNEALKPDTLLKTYTPVELRTWIESYKAYYTGSHFEKATVPERQAYFIKCLDSYLQNHVRSKIDTDTPVFKDPNNPEKLSCIQVLEDYFLLTYPLVARRFDLFSHKQATGESFLEFKTKMCAKANEADLEKLSKEDLLAFLLIAGTSNEKLQRKFLTLKDDPTLKTIEQEAHALESTQHSMYAIHGHTVAVNQVKRGAEGKNIQSGHGKGQRCKHCGLTNHTSAKCYKGHYVCKLCGDNHLERICPHRDQSPSRFPLEPGGDDQKPDDSKPP